MQTTLVLNADWSLLKIISWQKAIIYILRDAADIVRSYNTPVRSQHLTMSTPAIIKLKRYMKTRKNPPANKKNIFLRDGFVCQYSQKPLTKTNKCIDHVIPKCRGGSNSWTNMVACSRKINAFKADRLPGECGLELIKEPKCPTNSYLLAQSIRFGRNRIWMDFLEEYG